jgi:uncharacterized membrane protein
VILPIVATIWLLHVSITILSGPLSAILPQNIPLSISFLITILAITFIGIAAKNYFGKNIINFFEALLNKIPFINTIYRSTTQIVNAFSTKNKSFLSAVLLEYPRKGIWALGFVTKNDASGLRNAEGKDIGKGHSSVFVPTTPNPTSGVFIFVKSTELVPLELTVEESIKLLMSAGVVSPEKRESERLVNNTRT